MDWFDKLVRNLTMVNDKRHEIEGKGKPARKLTGPEFKSWMEQGTRPQPRTRAQIVAAISADRPARYARMRRDMKWLEKQAVKHGLSPQDARWLV